MSSSANDGQGAATGSGTVAKPIHRRRKKEMEPDSTEFIQKFKSIKPGMTQESVLKFLGNPTKKDNPLIWNYFENRLPLPGEQLSIYQIQFQNDKVSAAAIVPGPDATGPAPDTNNIINAMTADQTFQELKNFVKTHAGLGPDPFNTYDWIGKLNSWHDNAASGFYYHATNPELVAGNSIQKNQWREVGFKTLYGSQAAVSKERRYWAFSWKCPGVIEKAYFFYLDSTDGSMKLALSYTSPD